jgi:hypothetical protein
MTLSAAAAGEISAFKATFLFLQCGSQFFRKNRPHGIIVTGDKLITSVNDTGKNCLSVSLSVSMSLVMPVLMTPAITENP